jgi:hypothetical protein
MTKPDPNLPFEKAAAKDISEEQLAHEYESALQRRAEAPASLPTQWKDGHTGESAPGNPVQIVSPDAEEIAVFSNPRANVCGNCKFFDLQAGRKEIVRQRFGEKLVREFEWKLRHLGASPDAIGLCGQSGGETAVSYVSKSCDQFRPNK